MFARGKKRKQNIIPALQRGFISHLVWYDNENSYTSQMVRTLELSSQVQQ